MNQPMTPGEGRPTPRQYKPPQPVHPLGIISCVASLFIVFGYVGIVGSIAAIICGFIALRKIKQRNRLDRGRPFAQIGLIVGFGGLALLVVGIVLDARYGYSFTQYW
jgi:hypothetical protein